MSGHIADDLPQPGEGGVTAESAVPVHCYGVAGQIERRRQIKDAKILASPSEAGGCSEHEVGAGDDLWSGSEARQPQRDPSLSPDPSERMIDHPWPPSARRDEHMPQRQPVFQHDPPASERGVSFADVAAEAVVEQGPPDQLIPDGSNGQIKIGGVRDGHEGEVEGTGGEVMGDLCL
jgi:hypothetical protein